MFKELFCEHKWEMLKWDEKIVALDSPSRSCEFYFQCIKCGKRHNIRTMIRFDLIRRWHNEKS